MEIKDLLKETRYVLSYGDKKLSFGASLAETNSELADILENVCRMLRAKSKEVIGECDNCNEFLFKGEIHICEK